jgi:hypothetical protein
MAGMENAGRAPTGPVHKRQIINKLFFRAPFLKMRE